jgi:hypothetical protein
MQPKRHQQVSDISGDIDWFKKMLMSILRQALEDAVPMAPYNLFQRDEFLVKRRR